MKLTHKQKLRLARRMRSPWEIKAGYSPFTSLAWEDRKRSKLRKQIKQGQI